MTLRSDRPLERAVVTYCMFSVSSRLPRITRMFCATPPKPATTITGQTWLSVSMNLPHDHGAKAYCGELKFVKCCVPTVNASQYRISSARKKRGIDVHRKAKTVDTLSPKLYWWVAA